MKTGHDFDQAHINAVPPTDGNVLQVMPWSSFQNMADGDLYAMWSYLSARPA